MIPRLSLPVQLLITIGLVLICGSFATRPVVEFFFTLSTLMKDVLALILPFMVYTFVVTGIISFKKNAPIVLAILLSLVFISNALAALFAYGAFNAFISLVTNGITKEVFVNPDAVQAWYSLPYTDIIKSTHALLAALISGIVLSFCSFPLVERWIVAGKNVIEIFLKSWFIPLLPVYVLGFLLKIHYEGSFVTLFDDFGKAFVLIVVLQLLSIAIFYFVASGFSWTRMRQAITNGAPSYLTAFSCMSSTVTIPVTLEAAEKNTGNKPLAQMAVPIMANVHLLGDSIGTPILALTSMMLFMGVIPSFAEYIRFAFYFSTSMFAVSGIPGGGILVVTSLLESMFEFTSEMQGLIMMLYVLMDPFGTAANVMGDGALVIIVDKVLKRIGIR